MRKPSKTYRSSCSRAWAGTNRDRSLLAGSFRPDRMERRLKEKREKRKEKKRDHCLSHMSVITEEAHDVTTMSMTQQSNNRDDKNHGNFSYGNLVDDRPIDTHDRLGFVLQKSGGENVGAGG